MAGFGLSLAKWTLIVKHSTDFASGSDNTWLWWLFTAFGMIVCMRAIFQVQFRYFFRQISKFLEDSVDVFYGTTKGLKVVVKAIDFRPLVP